MEATYFLSGETLTAIVSTCGQYAAAGVAAASVFCLLGYVVWFLIDFARGVL